MAEFSLEQVLRYNQSIKNQKSLDFARAQLSVDRCTQKINQLKQKIIDLNRNYHSTLKRVNYNAGLMNIQQNYQADKEKELADLAKELEKLKKIATAKRQELVKSSIKFETLKILKNKYLKRLIEKQRRLDIKQMDEFAAQKSLTNKT